MLHFAPVTQPESHGWFLFQTRRFGKQMGFCPLGFYHWALLNDPESFGIRASTECSPAPAVTKPLWFLCSDKPNLQHSDSRAQSSSHPANLRYSQGWYPYFLISYCCFTPQAVDPTAGMGLDHPSHVLKILKARMLWSSVGFPKRNPFMTGLFCHPIAMIRYRVYLGFQCLCVLQEWFPVLLSSPQAWRPLWVPWSSQWRSCRMWWSWRCFASVSLLWLGCSCLWAIWGTSVWYGQLMWTRRTWITAPGALTGRNTPTICVGISAVTLPETFLFHLMLLPRISDLAITWAICPTLCNENPILWVFLRFYTLDLIKVLQLTPGLRVSSFLWFCSALELLAPICALQHPRACADEREIDKFPSRGQRSIGQRSSWGFSRAVVCWILYFHMCGHVIFSFSSPSANFYIIPGAPDPLLCGNSSDAGWVVELY